MDVNQIMEDIIDAKYDELNSLSSADDRFIKVKTFEGNAIGQVGESFVKKVFSELNIPLDDEREVVHDEYDILTNGKKIEIKTARQGLKNKTFQFNGINPIYNHDYIILIGIATNNLYYKILQGNSYYNHTTRKHYLYVDGELRQLVSMNPGNTVNYKLTLTAQKLDDITCFEQEIIRLFGNNE
ncbi:MAG: restriction endonuclease [Clostridia bacterium]|nr:restriction endonuclease [Clostridia bacterium]